MYLNKAAIILVTQDFKNSFYDNPDFFYRCLSEILHVYILFAVSKKDTLIWNCCEQPCDDIHATAEQHLDKG